MEGVNVRDENWWDGMDKMRQAGGEEKSRKMLWFLDNPVGIVVLTEMERLKEVQTLQSNALSLGYIESEISLGHPVRNLVNCYKLA